jgi:capsular exopolysaccharide synthesis family protein
MLKRLIKPGGQLTIVESGPAISELTIRGFLLILKRRRAIIAWTVSIFFLMGVVVCFFLTPRYKAMGEIEIQKSATDGLGLENLTNPIQDERADALDASITQQTQAMILQSKGLALKVIEDLNLEDTKDFRPTFNPVGWVLALLTPSGQADQPTAALEESPHRRDHAVKVFQKHLKITPQPGTRLIDIQYTSSDPRIAAAVVNDVAKSLVDYTLNSRYAATTAVSGWLTGQLADIKKEAEEQQGKVEELQRESGVYSLGISDSQGKEMAYSATLDRLQQATQALSTATANRILKGALYKSVQNGDPELISGLAGSSLAGASPSVNNSFLLIQNLRTQQAALASQYAADSSKYGSANPKLGDEKAGLDSVNTEIKSEVTRIGERAANDYAASQVVEDKMRGVYEQERKAADGQNDKAIALLIARQEAADSRTLYQTLYSHLKEAGVIAGLRSSNISIVDRGRAPSRPAPDIVICLALSLILGPFVGISAALFADATNERIDGIATIESALRTQILAVLPMTRDDASPGALARLAFKVRRMLTNGDQDANISNVAVLDGPNTAYVEALRGLRTLLLLSRNSPAPKTILITSAGEQEGKSTLSLNLAAALGLNGSRVLLVDGDMRSAGLSGYMGFERKPKEAIVGDTSGLSDALSGCGEPVIRTPFPELPRLSTLTAGASPRYPAELLGSDRMDSLAKSWAANYDYVLIDSPPVLAVADALILARLAETTLLVARHGRTTQKSLERAYYTLQDGRDTRIGVVVNGVHRNSVSFNEFYGYQGRTYYSEA